MSGNGVWRTGVNYNPFLVASGSTDSYHTGPASAYAGSYYAYCETSFPNYPKKPFDLQTHELPGRIGLVSFSYMAFGSSIGNMSLQGSMDEITWTTFWSKAENFGQSWSLASVSVPNEMYVRFYYTSGETYRGDFALDAITITLNPEPTPSPTLSATPT